MKMVNYYLVPIPTFVLTIAIYRTNRARNVWWRAKLITTGNSSPNNIPQLRHVSYLCITNVHIIIYKGFKVKLIQ